MKFLVVAYLLALASSASAGFYKTFEDIEDGVNNVNNEDDLTIAAAYKVLEESQDRFTYSNNDDNAPLVGVNETREENENQITDFNNIDAGFNGTYEEIEGRITNGYNAYTGQLPYQAFLRIQNYNGATWCGASLISSEWVLTAAHCIYTAASVTVYLGSIQRFYGTSRTVLRENIIIHHSYTHGNSYNDIALIKIPAVSFNSYIQPVKLPSMFSYPNSYAGENVIASGWGQTTDTNYAGTDYLRWARLQVITNNACSRAYRSTIPYIIVCTTTTGGTSICFGDSGGPMVTENSKVQIGVNAFVHSRQCTSGYPAGFTRVSSYLDWIKYYTGIYYT